MSQYFIDKLVYNNDTLDIHDTEAREMINTNTTNIQAVSARVTKNANDINTLKDTTGVIREDVDSLDDRMGVAETEIDGLKTRTTSLEGKMVTVENRLDGHDTKISDLEGRMDTAENNITTLDGRMTTAENDIDAAEHRLDLVEAKNDEQDIAIDDLETNVSKNTADIVDIKDDLTGIHKDIGDLDDRITASTYEAGIGIYFGQGAEHTNINVEDEILNQINQNTIDIQNLKTRVTNVENRLTVVEGDITDIKAEIVNIKADITALTVRVTALEAKILPAGGTKGQVLTKNSSTDYDVVWGDIDHYDYWYPGNISQYTYPGAVSYKCVIDNTNRIALDVSAFSDLIPFTSMQENTRLIVEQIVYGSHKRITVRVNLSAYLGDTSFVLSKFDNNPWRLDDNFPVDLGRFSTSTPLTIDNIPTYSTDSYVYQILDPANNITKGYNGIPCFKVTIAGSRDVYYAEVNAQNGNITTNGIYSNVDITIPMIEAFTLEVNIMTGTLVSLTSKSISFT